jgi:hypothetical protein
MCGYMNLWVCESVVMKKMNLMELVSDEEEPVAADWKVEMGPDGKEVINLDWE